LAPSPDRVEPPWPLGAQTGAADWLHVAPAAARAAKAQVLRDQLSHGAGLRPDFEVEPLGDGSPLGWRTKIELVVDQAGRAGMHRSTSHVFEPLTDMPLAVPAIRALDIFSRRWQPGSRLVAVAPSAGKAFCVDDAAAQCRRRREVVRLAGQVYHYELAASGFWQSLRLAPEMLVTAVLEALRPTSGQRIWELYAGAGLFTLPLAAAGARVSAVEGARQAVKDLRGNLRRAGLELEEIEHASAAKALRSGFGRSGRDGARSASPVAVLLDPPRAGAGRAVSEALIAAAPRRLVYLSCEPSTLARDLGFWTAAGYRLTGLRAFDLFPGTHHVEALATLTR
jgi:tRNA/tmRNA/rRNA uracil-C5-methylase (TrmA/RlmC/RlmD family)